MFVQEYSGNTESPLHKTDLSVIAEPLSIYEIRVNILGSLLMLFTHLKTLFIMLLFHITKKKSWSLFMEQLNNYNTTNHGWKSSVLYKGDSDN